MGRLAARLTAGQLRTRPRSTAGRSRVFIVFLKRAASTSCHSSAFLGFDHTRSTRGEVMSAIVPRLVRFSRWRRSWSTW